MNNRTTWLNERKKGIGGSDVAAVFGLSPFKTPFALYQEKRGEVLDTPDNPAMGWGRALEPVIRQHYANTTNRAVHIVDKILFHPQHAFMLANVDGVTDDKRVVEIKTARTSQGWGQEGTDEIPHPYLLQVQHYMAVTGFAMADVAVLIGGSDFRIYEVPADATLQAMMIEAEAQFWQKVVTACPPEPINFADMVAKFGKKCDGTRISATAELLDAIAHLKKLKEEAKLLSEAEEVQKAIVMKAMGEADTLAFKNDILATWKLSKPTYRFDTTAFKEKHPALYEDFLKASEPTRRFLLK